MSDRTSLKHKREHYEANFEISTCHILERLEQRFPQIAEKEKFLAGVTDCLVENTPPDWRFTESPSSRFFIVEETTGAKFMGLTYRNSDELSEILERIQSGSSDFPRVMRKVGQYADTYQQEVLRPDLPLLHNIRTVYGKQEKSGTIGEEKRLFEKAREELPHVIPIRARKIAARPNAVITEDRRLWVRQYLNWMSVRPNSPECYLFQPLERTGVHKSCLRIGSYNENGQLKLSPVNNLGCQIRCADLSQIKDSVTSSMRSENYWKVPTNLDRRLLDLQLCLDETMHPKRPGQSADEEHGNGLTSNELVELFILREIVRISRKKLHTK